MAMATVEAMQLGLVPVVTAVGEMAHYVSDGISGIIVDAADPDAGAAKLLPLLTDQARFSAMRQEAIRIWEDAPLYAEAICGAAAERPGGILAAPADSCA
jgi:glycosyltransferase involved in cell wall biosynthesis